MNLTSAGVMSASLVIGVGAAVTIFDAATSTGSEPAAVRSPVVLQEDRSGPNRGSRRFAPCEKPAKLEKGVCVTDQVRTVVVPPDGAPQTAPRAAAPLRQPELGRVEGHDDSDDAVVYDDDDDYDDPGSHTRTRTRSHDTGTNTSTGTQTRTRSGH
ncbi:MAG TPA: hypothetical protein VFO49_18265 [Nocardioides sp.]|nr:hypothetical protein [Nocardioides sp.]